MAYSFRPRPGAAQSGSARTPLAESMLTDNEVTASEALAILGSGTSREVVSANSKVADSTAVVPETQNSMLLAEAQVTSLTVNAGFTNSTINTAAPNFTVSTGFPNLKLIIAVYKTLQCRPTS